WIWIGGRESPDQEGVFLWSSSGEPIDITNFVNGYPMDTPMKSSIALDCQGQHRWVNDNPEETHAFICEVDLASAARP
ncbi:unnamed protein product, partial [Cyprideis torosa]